MSLPEIVKVLATLCGSPTGSVIWIELYDVTISCDPLAVGACEKDRAVVRDSLTSSVPIVLG